MTDIAKTARIEGIIDFALEDLSNWKAPQPLKSIGPVYPEAYKQVQVALDTFKVDLRTHLGFLTLCELENDFPQTITGTLTMLFDPDGQVGSLARRLARLKKTVPADYIGGWAIKGMAIDQAHWRGMKNIQNRRGAIGHEFLLRMPFFLFFFGRLALAQLDQVSSLSYFALSINPEFGCAVFHLAGLAKAGPLSHRSWCRFQPHCARRWWREQWFSAQGSPRRARSLGNGRAG